MPGASGLAHLARRREVFQVKQLCRDAETDFGQNSYARTQERISGKAAMPGHRNGFRAKQLCQDTSAVLRQSFHAWIREWSRRRDKNVVPVGQAGNTT